MPRSSSGCSRHSPQSEFKGGYDWAKEKKRDKKLAKLLDFDLEQAEKIRGMQNRWEMLEEQFKLANQDLAAASSPALDGGEATSAVPTLVVWTGVIRKVRL